MSMQDPIADMFVRIRNAQAVAKVQVSVPMSKHKEQIAKLLQAEGYIESYRVEVDADNRPVILIALKYFNGKPVIARLARESKPGVRVYKTVDQLPKVQGGLGVVIVSTSMGLMSDRQARKMGQGGEIIGTVS